MLANELAQLRLRYNEQHPDIRKLKEELAAAKEAEEAEDKQTAARLAAAPPRPAKKTTAARIKASPNANPADVIELTKAQERVAALKDRSPPTIRNSKPFRRSGTHPPGYTALSEPIDSLPSREQEISDLMRDYEITKGYLPVADQQESGGGDGRRPGAKR